MIIGTEHSTCEDGGYILFYISVNSCLCFFISFS